MKPSRRLLGLLSTTVLCLAPALGAAQDVQTPPKSKRPPSEAKSEAITVTGRGSTREVQGLSQTQLTQSFVSGTSVLKALGTLPGVSYQTSDPLGIDPWSQSFYIRGFSSAQLGFTLDDIPLGNPGYGSIGGVNLTNAISPQNVEQINVSQSAGPVDVASSDNLGGVVQAYSRDPSDKHGGELSQGFGSNSAYLTFIRLDSGALNPTGTKFYVSYYRANEGKWKGSGSMNLDQLNFKLQQPIGEASEANVFFDWDSARDDTYDDLSNEIVSKLGTRVDYLEPNFAAAYGVANYEQGRPGASLPPGYAQLSDPVDASYYNGPALEEDYIGGAKFNLELAGGLRWKTTFYGIGKSFGAYWPNPYLDSPDGAPIAVQNRGDNAPALRRDVRPAVPDRPERCRYRRLVRIRPGTRPSRSSRRRRFWAKAARSTRSTACRRRSPPPTVYTTPTTRYSPISRTPGIPATVLRSMPASGRCCSVAAATSWPTASTTPASPQFRPERSTSTRPSCRSSA